MLRLTLLAVVVLLLPASALARADAISSERASLAIATLKGVPSPVTPGEEITVRGKLTADADKPGITPTNS